ncbi:MAG: AAA family ATPase, partial [Bacteroidetes bacterium SB0662_bin_6]|nr:AAA family ATPase [Bacteroidetes bacterium SB0662_bin_6]
MSRILDPTPTPEHMRAREDPRELARSVVAKLRAWQADPQLFAGPEHTDGRRSLDADADFLDGLRNLRRPKPPPPGYAAADLAYYAAIAEAESPEAARALFEPVRLRALTEHLADPIPEPVIWREPATPQGERIPDAVLSVGEVAILAAEGGTGKSTLTLALAHAAALARENGENCGAAGALRVKPGGAVLVAFEDSAARMARRLAWIAEAEGGRPFDTVRIVADPDPLFEADPEQRGVARPAPAWASTFEQIRKAAPALVVVDPVSVALAGASTSEAGPVRAFMRAMIAEAEAGEFGILAVAHSTKQARAEARQGEGPGPGAVAGSAAWYDSARGCLTLTRDPVDSALRVLECVKANHGASGWGAVLAERFTEGGRFAGFETREQLTPEGMRERRKGRAI